MATSGRAAAMNDGRFPFFVLASRVNVGEQGELGNDQGAVPAVEHGEVHLLVVVFEDPEVRDLLREEVRFCFRIVLVDAEQDEKSAVDRPEGLPFYDDAGGGDPLDDSFH